MKDYLLSLHTLPTHTLLGNAYFLLLQERLPFSPFYLNDTYSSPMSRSIYYLLWEPLLNSPTTFPCIHTQFKYMIFFFCIISCEYLFLHLTLCIVITIVFTMPWTRELDCVFIECSMTNRQTTQHEVEWKSKLQQSVIRK